MGGAPWRCKLYCRRFINHCCTELGVFSLNVLTVQSTNTEGESLGFQSSSLNQFMTNPCNSPFLEDFMIRRGYKRCKQQLASQIYIIYNILLFAAKIKGSKVKPYSIGEGVFIDCWFDCPVSTIFQIPHLSFNNS